MVFQVIPWDLAPETVLHLPTAVEMALLAVAVPHPTAVGTAEATQIRLLSIKYWIFWTIHDHWHENTAEIRINFRNCSKLSYNYATHCHWTNFSNREQNKLQTWNMWKCRFSCSAILRNWECPPPNSFHLDILTIPFVTVPDGLRTFETRQATFHPFLNFIESVLGDSFGSCQKTCQFWDRDSDDEPRCRCSIPKTSLLLQWNRELLVFPDIPKDFSQSHDRRKFRRQTSDNMDKWESRGGRSQKREEKESEEKKSREALCFSNVLWLGGSKSRLAKAAGVEPSGEMRDEKLHAVVRRSRFRSQNVARSTYRSQKCKKLRISEHYLRLRCRKSTRRCGAKHMSKSKCEKHTMSGSLLDFHDATTTTTVTTTTPTALHHTTTTTTNLPRYMAVR